ncbi:MAG TPA: GNAT family N-acetyltransferase [Chthoniobacterales bacterium]|nr:GNAT family N-acetyltransferase [Chthoniobacterales bacterium]
MNLRLRPGTPDDAKACGTICYHAFKAIAEAHNFPRDFPSPEVATGVLSWMLSHPGFYSVVAEIDGRIVGSNFLDERSPIAGVGPITINPAAQNKSVGRRLMEAVHERAAQKNFAGVRLLQGAYHTRSFSLYTKLGYDVREPLTCLQGSPLNAQIPGYAVRAARESDLEKCNALCQRVHGHDRGGDLLDAIKQRTATVVEREGRLTGYATLIGFFGHAVGETNGDLQALIGAAKEFPGPGFMLPSRNSELLRWCLQRGLRVVQPMTLMSRGFYQEPAGAFLPSILY